MKKNSLLLSLFIVLSTFVFSKEASFLDNSKNIETVQQEPEKKQEKKKAKKKAPAKKSAKPSFNSTRSNREK